MNGTEICFMLNQVTRGDAFSNLFYVRHFTGKSMETASPPVTFNVFNKL